MPIPKFATEGATKWDCGDYFQSNVKSASAGQSALFKSRKHVNEGGWSRKMNEERASSMRTQWRSVINNLAEGVKTERRFCKKMDRMNSNLLRDIAEAKLSARKLIRHLEKEKAAREELEDVCYDLAKEIEGRKAEIGALRNEQRRFEEEVEEERRMQQMAEVWREEQAQMKLADAKFILEDKYVEVNEVIADLRAFLRRSNVDVRSKVEVVRQAFECGVKDLSCVIPESDKAFAVIEDSQTSEADCASIVQFISNELKDASRRKMSEGESERSVRRACMSKTKRKVQKGCQKSEGSEVSSISWMQPKSAASPVLDARTNPHVVRAMTGHNQWPWRIQRHGLEAKLEGQKMLLRNVLKQKT